MRTLVPLSAVRIQVGLRLRQAAEDAKAIQQPGDLVELERAADLEAVDFPAIAVCRLADRADRVDDHAGRDRPDVGRDRKPAEVIRKRLRINVSVELLVEAGDGEIGRLPAIPFVAEVERLRAPRLQQRIAAARRPRMDFLAGHAGRTAAARVAEAWREVGPHFVHARPRQNLGGGKANTMPSAEIDISVQAWQHVGIFLALLDWRNNDRAESTGRSAGPGILIGMDDLDADIAVKRARFEHRAGLPGGDPFLDLPVLVVVVGIEDRRQIVISVDAPRECRSSAHPRSPRSRATSDRSDIASRPGSGCARS